MGQLKGAPKTKGSFKEGHPANMPKDKYGKRYRNPMDAEYADLCYDLTEFLSASDEISMGLEAATMLVEKIRQSTPASHVVRSKLASFLILTEHQLKRTPGRL